MNIQPTVQTRPTSTGIGRRKLDRDMATRLENKMPHGKLGSSNHGSDNGSKLEGHATPSRDLLTYAMAYFIGHRVEVQVKNGSVISGIFHGARTNKDSDIVLKMAYIIKDGSSKGSKPATDIVRKPHTMIIPEREFVQIFAEGLILGKDESSSAQAHDKPKDLLIDSVISHAHHGERERELMRWMPDEDDPECAELENIFDKKWNRNWDQFETNEALFGVKSTFDEELYTTKLERGPQMRELEREAYKIAREIEGEESEDPHLAEERGNYINEDYDFDEESRYSAVTREVDNKRSKETENLYFGLTNLSSKISMPISATTGDKVANESQASSSNPSWDAYRIDDGHSKDYGDQINSSNKCAERMALQDSLSSKSDDVQPSTNLKGSSPSAAAFDPLSSSHKSRTDNSDCRLHGKVSSANENVIAPIRPSSSAFSTSDQPGSGSALSGPGLSRSSSIGSLSSEKSTLNPNAKEFKLNPNAKSFTPSASSRSHTPISDGAIYYASPIPMQHMHGLPMGMGIDQSLVHSPAIYNSQAALQPHQAYYHPNVPLYGQQMIPGQGRPMYILSNYPPEMPYPGRNS